jgi:hypothetical protein
VPAFHSAAACVATQIWSLYPLAEIGSQTGPKEHRNRPETRQILEADLADSKPLATTTGTNFGEIAKIFQRSAVPRTRLQRFGSMRCAIIEVVVDRHGRRAV